MRRAGSLAALHERKVADKRAPKGKADGRMGIKGRHRQHAARRAGGMRRAALLGACTLALGGCLAQGGGNDVSRLASGPAGTSELSPAQREAAASPVITALQSRRSLLPPGSAYSAVSDAVLAANSRTAEAELRAARLRASAASKNWLPQIGPSISLTSLSDVVANIVLEQVLLDHGRLKAERAFAKADVEVAAVDLADDTNARVFTALTLYLDAAQARERAALDTRTLSDMGHFNWIMQERVAGGVSDRSDLSVLDQKLGEIRLSLTSAQEAERTALAELNAMAATPLDGVTGLTNLPPIPKGPRALSVLRAIAEEDRSVAEARTERAGLLPGLTANGTVGSDNDGGINLGGGLLGLGTGDSLRAIEMQKDAAARQTAQAEEDAARTLRRLEQQIIALERQADEAAALAAQARTNLDLFQEQYDGGQRQVMDVVGVYETFAARQQSALDRKYELARARLQSARLLGLLADGSRI
ncbi:outer membrane protein, adhesin transport system [Roseovarius nanhaiticus]|uniref:Outer membrane protein, adhesin transport system n=1 Tax=Roseovarius nanhaiticus TaxID=573024 RepID=A0A1N7G5C3_9RHOB|nr:outer membrane protein, adhesin transport system [Roseovarius nanhaiticus]SIS07626.1 outer membrane protein, adhesin transport system [Roseovarius nanhaiticus]